MSIVGRLRPITCSAKRSSRHGGGTVDTWHGVLTWHDQAGRAKAVVREHMAWEYDTWIIERAEIIALEPALVVPPDIVAYSPGEGTVDPDAVTEISVNAPPGWRDGAGADALRRHHDEDRPYDRF
jgi:hypothetical protein